MRMSKETKQMLLKFNSDYAVGLYAILAHGVVIGALGLYFYQKYGGAL